MASPPPPPPAAEPGPADPARLELKAMGLLVLLLVLVGSSLAYILYARGVFEPTQRLVLIADDSEGVRAGMDLTFSGFPIGRVRSTALAHDGKVRIEIDVARKDAGWLRSSSVFTMEKGLVGDTRLRAFSNVLADPPLPDGAERVVLRGDASAEIPRLLSTVRALTENLERMTGAEAPLNATLGNLQSLSGTLKGPYGGLAVALGSEANARKLLTTLDRTNQLLLKADQQVFGAQGLVRDTQASVVQLNALLGELRGSLRRMDAVLADAQVIAGNTRAASTDLGALRAQVETSLRRVESLVNEIHRKWPLSRDTEIRLP